MALPKNISEALRLPVMAAPMFLVSGPDLVTASMDAGIIGSFPTANARDTSVLKTWLTQISEHRRSMRSNGRDGIWSANVVSHRSNNRLQDDLDMIKQFEPPIVITALGGPGPVLETVHSFGGSVWADVNSVEFARKAVERGADGLVLVCAGAGGHTGSLTPFAFLTEVRSFFDGPIALGGGISSGSAVAALELAGADIANMGSAFIATPESLVSPAYRKMLIDAGIQDLVLSDSITGVKAYWLRQSLINEGYDPDNLAAGSGVDFAENDENKERRQRWTRIWSAGQGINQITKIESVAQLVDRLAEQYKTALASIGNRRQS